MLVTLILSKSSSKVKVNVRVYGHGTVNVLFSAVDTLDWLEN